MCGFESHRAHWQDGWVLVDRVDPNDVDGLTAIARDGFWFGKFGDVDPGVAVNDWEVFPPLRRADFVEGPGGLRR